MVTGEQQTIKVCAKLYYKKSVCSKLSWDNKSAKKKKKAQNRQRYTFKRPTYCFAEKNLYFCLLCWFHLLLYVRCDKAKDTIFSVNTYGTALSLKVNDVKLKHNKSFILFKRIKKNLNLFFAQGQCTFYNVPSSHHDIWYLADIFYT